MYRTSHEIGIPLWWGHFAGVYNREVSLYLHVHTCVCVWIKSVVLLISTHTHSFIELHSWCIIRVAVCWGGWCWGWSLPQLSLHCVHYIHCWWEPGTPLHLYSTPYECAGETNTPSLITHFWGWNFESDHNFSSILSLLKHATDLYILHVHTANSGY